MPESAVIDEACCGYGESPHCVVGGLKVWLQFHQGYGLASTCTNSKDSIEAKKILKQSKYLLKTN